MSESDATRSKEHRQGDAPEDLPTPEPSTSTGPGPDVKEPADVQRFAEQSPEREQGDG